MSGLPKLQTSSFTHKLIGIGKTINYRRFLVKEQKILLEAKESGDKDSIFNAVKTIITNCTFGEIDPDDLPTFDLEDLFIRIRAKSVGEEINVKYEYRYKEDDKDKREILEATINIDDIKVVIDPEHTNKIMLTDSIGIVMKYPTFKILSTVEQKDIIYKCVDYIFDNDQIYKASDFTKEELEEFFDDMDDEQIGKIDHFLNTMPRLEHKISFNTKDGKVKEVTLKGLNDFFM